jgi:small subunit ribosomal protein S9
MEIQNKINKTTICQIKQAVGRRKSALAQVKLITPGSGELWINGKPGYKYLQNKKFLMIMLKAPLLLSEQRKRIYNINIKVTGGGFVSQTQAIKLGIARALSLCETEKTRQLLKAAGFLTCDSRVKERKKYGLKKARKSPQFSKR